MKKEARGRPTLSKPIARHRGETDQGKGRRDTGRASARLIDSTSIEEFGGKIVRACVEARV